MSDRARPLAALLALLGACCTARGAAAQTPPALPGPLTLRRAIELALAHAPEVAVADAARAASEAELRLARDSFRPAAEISTNPGVARGLPVAVVGRVPALAGVAGHQTLYDPAERSRLLETEAGVVAREAQGERRRRDAARAAAVAYVRFWADRELARAAAEREKALERSFERARNLEREGRVTGLAVEQVHLRAERARLQRLGNEAEGDLDRLELARLTGAPAAELTLAADPADPADPTAELPDPAPGIADLPAARAADPDLAAGTVALDLLEQATLRRRGIRPTVEAEAQYYRLDAGSFGRFYRRFRSDDWSVALSIALPLWTGGRAADALARAQANLTEKTAERRAQESELALAVRRAESARDRAQAAAVLARQGEALAAEDLRVTRALLAEGRVGEDEVDAKQAALADAEEADVEARRDLLSVRIELLALRGELPGFGAAPDAARVPGTLESP
jgi:outer membrane protein